MSLLDMEEILRQVSHWPRDQRLALVQSLNRLTIAERADAISRQAQRHGQDGPLTDSEIDAAVGEVRKERPLHQRSSTQAF